MTDLSRECAESQAEPTMYNPATAWLKDQDLRGSFDCVVMSAAEDDTTLDALPAAYQQQNPKP